ncbi:MAG: lysophospholipid transporter LplT [Burkholderiaceae bacterium]|uniref:lysophospholipid transporter LplT n=1 Tax=Polynucleobacter sp. MWH-Loch1C5 TaxID=2689108 RepID=UPI001C0E68F8|nr:lysophospholipid transporter LplT [Polynucleobacter sp. MWH-Loch1C5]MBU3543246.1 lysophospholipid transporter LplT [Polynucleobacter sp. MWH-Loch1C5]NBV00540.1 lysophospholipid transporter LplT [Burkholderiaceae bacterium]
MKPGFYTIMAAQFFSSLADNALLIAAIALLYQLHAPAWMTPLLKLFFVLSYVLLAAFVGAFADSRPKGRVMFLTNSIKIVGCLAMLFSAHPLLAYAIVGFGAAAYSPAKYGILTELLPAEKLVVANGWIEGLTVGSIILGTVLGGVLISDAVTLSLLSIDLPRFETGIDTGPEAAIAVIAFIYLIAALFNLRIPDTGARYPQQEKNPIKLIKDFEHCFKTLWNDRLGQISLAVTTLFWGAGATLQFIVLKWAEYALGMNLSQGAILQAVVAFGVAGGAVWAAARVPLKKALNVLIYGVIMGALVMLMAIYRKDLIPDVAVNLGLFKIQLHLLIAYVFLITIGWMSGYFVVPMNALLQHRGHVLLSAGHSIAVQNFNENLSVLSMLCLYALLIWLDVPISIVIVLFGSFVCLVMIQIMRWHRRNQAEYDSLHLIGEEKHH